MTVEPLPLPDDDRLTWLLNNWLAFTDGSLRFPRSAWLGQFEGVLREHYPQATSRQLTLTARLAAPFPLAKPGVP